jgi:hypothetical protein
MRAEALENELPALATYAAMAGSAGVSTHGVFEGLAQDMHEEQRFLPACRGWRTWQHAGQEQMMKSLEDVSPRSTYME